jgi:hypothetical protein
MVLVRPGRLDQPHQGPAGDPRPQGQEQAVDQPFDPLVDADPGIGKGSGGEIELAQGLVEDRPVQRLLVAEMVVDRRQIRPSRGTDVPGRGPVVAMFRERHRRRPEQAVAGVIGGTVRGHGPTLGPQAIA